VGSCTGGTGNNECSDGSQSSLGEGPGDWYVASIQITMAAAEATLSVFNINGTDVRTGGADVLLGAGCTDYTFEIDRLFWDNIMVAEFIGWDEALSADAISTAENYLAYTYTLGAGLDPVNDSMDSADVDVQIESIFYGESVEAGEYLEVESDARTVIVRAGDSDYSEQLKLCSGSGETNCVAFEADANGDAVITPDGGDATVVADLTIGDGTAADITLTFDTDGTESLFWDDSESGFTPSAKWTFAGGDRTIFEIRQFGTPFGLDYTASSGSLAQYTFQHLFEAQDGVGGTRTLLRMTGGVSGVFNVIAPSISFDGFVAFTAINVTAGTGGQGTGVLTKTVNVITSASANDDVTLPSHTSGRVIWAFNQSGVAVDMYPPANDAINGLAVDALITLKAGYVNVCSSTATSLVWVCLEAALPAS